MHITRPLCTDVEGWSEKVVWCSGILPALHLGSRNVPLTARTDWLHPSPPASGPLCETADAVMDIAYDDADRSHWVKSVISGNVGMRALQMIEVRSAAMRNILNGSLLETAAFSKQQT